MDYVVSGAVEALVLVVGLYLGQVRSRGVGAVVGGMLGDDVFAVEGVEEEEYITSVSLGEETPLLTSFGIRIGGEGRRWEGDWVFRSLGRWCM